MSTTFCDTAHSPTALPPAERDDQNEQDEERGEHRLEEPPGDVESDRDREEADGQLDQWVVPVHPEAPRGLGGRPGGRAPWRSRRQGARPVAGSRNLARATDSSG